MKRIRIIAVVAALITALAIYLYLSDLKKPETIERVPVVVAVKDIAQGQTITGDMVSIRQLPTEAVVGMAAADIDLIVGRISAVDVKPDEQLLVTQVFEAGETKSGLAYSVDRGKRAITVPVDQVTGVAGFLKPRDRVDVLAILDINGVLSPEQFNRMLDRKNSGKAEPEPSAQAGGQSQPLRLVFSMVLLQDIEVLATGQTMKRSDDSSDPSIVETVTLSVTPEQALRLNLVLAEGNVRLVMRSPGDDSLPELEGVSVANLIDSRDIDILTLLGEIAPTASPTPSPGPEATPQPTASPEPTASAG